VQVRLAHTSSGLSTAAISFDAYPQGKCALCGKKGMVHNPAEVQAARSARLATTSRRPIGLALRPAYSAAMRGCTARPVRRRYAAQGGGTPGRSLGPAPTSLKCKAASTRLAELRAA